MFFEDLGAISDLQAEGKKGATDRESFDLMYNFVLKDPRMPPATENADDIPEEFAVHDPTPSNDPFPDQDV